MNFFPFQDKALKILEWIFFIGFSIVALWFASGVLQQFFSHKTSFSQYEEEVAYYPVISIFFYDYQASEVNLNDIKIHYGNPNSNCIKEMGYALEIGDNYFPSKKYNKTEKIILESQEEGNGRKAFRIIHATPILDKKSSLVDIRLYTKLEEKNGSFSDAVAFFLTSQENSPGFFDKTWKDGKSLQIAMKKNTFVKYTIQPQVTKYLEGIGKCQKESYYKCIASQLDAIEFNECSTKKCMPNVFSNMEKSFNTPFCQNDTATQQCIFNYISNKTVGANCKKSCSILEYLGESVLNFPYQSKSGAEYENWNVYWLQIELTNQDLLSKVFEEFLIYDVIGMIGSVGGTLGMFIEF